MPKHIKKVKAFAGAVRKATRLSFGKALPKHQGGACSYAAKALSDLLKAQGVPARFAVGTFRYRGSFVEMGHCWVELGNTIIDTTATQFGIRRAVYVVKAAKERRYQTQGVDFSSLKRIWEPDAHPDAPRIHQIKKLAKKILVDNGWRL